MEVKDLNETFKKVTEVVPTIVVIGETIDHKGMMMMNSPEETDERKGDDLSRCVAMMMQTSEQVRNILLAAVSYFMQINPEYQKHMLEAIKLLKKTQWN